MEIRHLRYFLAVAEHGSVAQAARKLNIVQPALSRQIHDLEDQLGTPLFERSVRGVQLTAAGKQFVRDTQRLLADLDAARDRALRAAAGMEGTVRIGISHNHTWHPLILQRLRRFQRAFPNVALMLEPSISTQQLIRIKEGRLDGGFIALRDPNDSELAGIKVLSSGLLLAVPSHSKYAKKPPARLRDLKDEPCVWFPRERSPVYHDYLIHQCQRAGLSPRLVPIGTDVATTLGMVAAGMGYSIVTEMSKYNSPKEVVLHHHPDLSDVHDVELVTRSDADSPILREFARVMSTAGPRDAKYA
ncbi:LysR family transcriptional regulator [Herbaspirillum robiniae]|uniref:LysR family transcriptional regulator n=1 Tax=Herbaspirillum robiniae TaxID=2014887 RepID=A0A246WQK9_9BURK|nr:LysR family transcriptional regulator [Herbaspirillum robiniae]NUU04101.1 LysR family transcriptional regulator [Herbaspirillum robiniae]OWY28654.1 LysR family transcriptional regulator [Herbaspirillum robiniae]